MKIFLWVCIIILWWTIGLIFCADYSLRVADFLCNTVNYCKNIITDEEKNSVENSDKDQQYDDITTYRKDIYNEERWYFSVSSWSTTYENPYRWGNGRLKLYGSLINNFIDYNGKIIASVEDWYIYYDKLQILIPQWMQWWSYDDSNVDQKIWSWAIDQSLLLGNYFFSEATSSVQDTGEKNIVIKKSINDLMSKSTVEEVCGWWLPGDMWLPNYEIEKFQLNKNWIEQYISYTIFDNEWQSSVPHYSNRMCFKFDDVYYTIFLQNIDRTESEKIFNSVEIIK